MGQLDPLELQPIEHDYSERPELQSCCWTSHVSSYFYFLICKMGVIGMPASEDCSGVGHVVGAL